MNPLRSDDLIGSRSVSGDGIDSSNRGYGAEKPINEVKASMSTTTEEADEDYYDEFVNKDGERPEYPPVPFHLQG